MSKTREVVNNVQAFLDKTSAEVGRMKAEEFSSFARWIIQDDLKSPIEDLFFIAFCAQVEAEKHDLNPLHGRGIDGELKEGDGIFIKPQFQIGFYRADFLVYNTYCRTRVPVLVELDGHNFHDRDKHQRAYEKARDRFFVKHGFKVLHFTGSEIVADPHKAAFEVLSVIDGVMTRTEYDSKFPLGE